MGNGPMPKHNEYKEIGMGEHGPSTSNHRSPLGLR
jgi:hypothetical protein